MGRVIELIPSSNNQVRGAKVVIGKTRAIIQQPISKLYRIECENEQIINSCDNTVELFSDKSINGNEQGNTNDNSDAKDTEYVRPKRKAAVLADIKRKIMTY